MNALERMRQAVADQRYRISVHAIDEMSDDRLESADVERVILGGRISKVFTRDPRGTRYEVAGETTDRRRACVVCRFLASDVLLVITAYAVEE
ncbi:MAG: DUF4258 domain-containing protein [Deltaproteobacteria bacterium]|nr:DUF4258 domain-containing protein [Deltaproteobacteria bacterium]